MTTQEFEAAARDPLTAVNGALGAAGGLIAAADLGPVTQSLVALVAAALCSAITAGVNAYARARFEGRGVGDAARAALDAADRASRDAEVARLREVNARLIEALRERGVEVELP